MARSLIDTRKAWRMRELAATLPKRMDAVKRYIVQAVAKDMAGQVASRAPHSPGLPSNYPDLEVVAVASERGPAAAAIYVSKATRIGSLDPARTALYVRSFDDAGTTPIDKAVRALESLSPFVMDTLPASIPRERGYFMFRRARPDEIIGILERNAKDRSKIDAAIQGSGLDPHVDHDAVAAYSDVVFEVLRAEFGYGDVNRPHWRPAVRAVTAGSTMRLLLGDAELAKTLIDPRYRGWVKLGILGQTLTLSEVEPLDRFQSRILD